VGVFLTGWAIPSSPNMENALRVCFFFLNFFVDMTLFDVFPSPCGLLALAFGRVVSPLSDLFFFFVPPSPYPVSPFLRPSLGIRKVGFANPLLWAKCRPFGFF